MESCMTVGTELPIHQPDVRFVLAVAGYPYVVVLLDVGGVVHVVVDEHLADIQYGPHAGTLFHDVHKGTYALHQHVVAAYLLDLRVGRFHVEHRREVPLTDDAVAQEVLCLLCGR